MERHRRAEAFPCSSGHVLAWKKNAKGRAARAIIGVYGYDRGRRRASSPSVSAIAYWIWI
jgi:hypothetical protein